MLASAFRTVGDLRTCFALRDAVGFVSSRSWASRRQLGAPLAPLLALGHLDVDALRHLRRRATTVGWIDGSPSRLNCPRVFQIHGIVAPTFVG
jgi:hypothetical protein